MKHCTKIVFGIALLSAILVGAFFPYDTDNADQEVREAYGDDIFTRTQTPACTSDGVGLERVPFGVAVTHCETRWFVLFNLVAFSGYREKEDEAMPREQREELVSGYLEENISRLSPDPEVLGGTFYVTDITFTGENSGTVSYEDGHIALVADFAYSVSGEGALEVTLSNVRENRP